MLIININDAGKNIVKSSMINILIRSNSWLSWMQLDIDQIEQGLHLIINSFPLISNINIISPYLYISVLGTGLLLES